MPTLKIDISIHAKTVAPLNNDYPVARGTSVTLVTESDQDATLKVTGPGLDKSVFIDKLSTIPTTFIADQTGTIVISSVDPAATIARLTVS